MNSASQNPEDFNLSSDYYFSENSRGNFFYKIYNTPRNYGDAKAQCESDGAFLAIPRSQAENDFFAGLVPNQYIWIGIDYNEQEGSFVAVDGREISWTNWLTGQPDGDTSQFAVAIRGSCNGSCNGTYNGRWYDRTASMGSSFVCSIYIEGTNFRFELFRPFLSKLRPE